MAIKEMRLKHGNTWKTTYCTIAKKNKTAFRLAPVTKTTTQTDMLFAPVSATLLNWNPHTNLLFFMLDTKRYKAKIYPSESGETKHFRGYLFGHPHITSFNLEVTEATSTQASGYKAAKKTHVSADTLYAPLAGKVIKILVKKDQQVKRDTCVIIIESMKMENEIRCEADMKVTTIKVAQGDMVKAHQPLITFK